MAALIDPIVEQLEPAVAETDWRVLRVMTGKEPQVQAQLMHADLDGLTLMYQAKRSPHGIGRPEMVSRPLFPGYVLLRCADEQRGDILRYMAFVIDFLRFGSYFAKVTDDEVQRAQIMLQSDFHAIARPQLFPGTKVRVKYGSMSGLVGEFSKYKGEEQVVINMAMFGRSLAARMSRDQVEAIA